MSFVHSFVTWDIWKRLCGIWGGLLSVITHVSKFVVESLLGLGRMIDCKARWSCDMFAMISSFWLEKTNIIFKSQFLSKYLLFDRVVFSASFMCLAAVAFGGVAFANAQCPWRALIL